MAILRAGKLRTAKRKLHLFIGEKIKVKNDTDMDLVVIKEENVDGSKPSIVIRIKRIIHKGEQERSIL